ncbi:MAG: hypothetical protein GF330_08295 [Candidatus Eisenbacteria bacterium]|nr:hypothetical protein [Candidatus Eisenbacteria bacterium]
MALLLAGAVLALLVWEADPSSAGSRRFASPALARVRARAEEAFASVDTLAIPRAPVLADSVIDGVFAYLLGLLDRQKFGAVTGAHLQRVLEVTDTRSCVPTDLVREIRRAQASSEDGWARARFHEDLDFPVPYSILGYHPGSLLASRDALFEERYFPRLRIPNPDPDEPETIEIRDVTLWSLVSGEIVIDIDGWVDFLLGGRLDDTYVVALAVFRFEGERLAVATGFNDEGRGRSGTLDLSRNTIRFPASSANKAIGRGLRGHAVRSLGRLGIPAWVPPGERGE